MYNSSLTHVDKKYYVQTNVRDLLSIKSSFQKIYYIFYIEVLKNSYLFIGWEGEHNYEKGLYNKELKIHDNVHKKLEECEDKTMSVKNEMDNFFKKFLAAYQKTEDGLPRMPRRKDVDQAVNILDDLKILENELSNIG